MLKVGCFLRKPQISQVNNSRILRIKNAKLIGYCFYMNPNMQGNFQICISEPLKVVPATFLLVCFVCLKDSTFKTRKNVFYFTWKALFVFEIIRFKLIRYSNVMTSSNA